MTSRLLSVAALAGTLLWATQGFAAQITGQLDLVGVNTFTPTTVTFPTGTADIPSPLATTLDYLELGGPCIDCVAVNDMTTATPIGTLLYTATNNGATATFTTTSLLTFDPINIDTFHGLFVVGFGTATLTGFDETPASFSLTTQCNTNGCNNGTITVSFSSTTLSYSGSRTRLSGSAGLGAGRVWRDRSSPSYRGVTSGRNGTVCPRESATAEACSSGNVPILL
jgi:hypothetical protein